MNLGLNQILIHLFNLIDLFVHFLFSLIQDVQDRCGVLADAGHSVPGQLHVLFLKHQASLWWLHVEESVAVPFTLLVYCPVGDQWVGASRLGVKNNEMQVVGVVLAAH